MDCAHVSLWRITFLVQYIWRITLNGNTVNLELKVAITLKKFLVKKIEEAKVKSLIHRRAVGTARAEGACATPMTFSHVNVLFFLFDKGRWWTFLLKSFQYLVFLVVILSILTHLGCCNNRKLKSPWGLTPVPTWWVYSASYGPTLFSLRENYKCLLWTLPLQSLRPSDGPGL